MSPNPIDYFQKILAPELESLKARMTSVETAISGLQADAREIRALLEQRERVLAEALGELKAINGMLRDEQRDVRSRLDKFVEKTMNRDGFLEVLDHRVKALEQAERTVELQPRNRSGSEDGRLPGASEPKHIAEPKRDGPSPRPAPE